MDQPSANMSSREAAEWAIRELDSLYCPFLIAEKIKAVHKDVIRMRAEGKDDDHRLSASEELFHLLGNRLTILTRELQGDVITFH